MASLCENCGSPDRVRGERYCKSCRTAVLEQLKEAGYLTPKPRATRSVNDTENRKVGRWGDPSPWGENAVKAMEGE